MDYLDILVFDWRIFGQPGVEALKDMRDMNLADKGVVVENGFSLKGGVDEIPGDQFDAGATMFDSIV
jgi:hypothetical protein